MKKQCTIEKSDLIATLDRNIEFVDRCDMKVSIVLAILGVILTIIFTNDGISSLWHILKTAFSFKNTSFDVVYLFFLVLFAAGYSYGMLKLIMVLYYHTSSSSGKSPLTSSVSSASNSPPAAIQSA